MCANCCSSVYDLGCFPCGNLTVTLPVDAGQTGTFTAHFRYLGTEILKEFEGTLGEPLVVPTTGLNSDFTFDFYVEDPDGERVEFGAYDCFRLQLHVARIGAEPDPIDLSGATCDQLSSITKEQKLECILPTLDFEDAETLEALSDDQEDDLIDALCGPGGPCDDATVENSDQTYSETVAAGATLVLPDVSHTDSDGAPVVLPALTPFVATLCGAPVLPDYYYPIAIGHP